MLDEIVNFKPSGFRKRMFNRIDPRTRQKGNLRNPKPPREKQREKFATAAIDITLAKRKKVLNFKEFIESIAW
jgi:hypothetical protein